MPPVRPLADGALPIADVLRELGFDSPESQAVARAAMIEVKLTNPSKHNIAREKLSRLEETLSAAFLVTCGTADCAGEAEGKAVVVAHDRARCWVCGGSNNRRAVEQATSLFRSKRVRKIVVVGGSPGVHGQLRELAPPEWEVRIVDGTERRTGDAAQSDLRWADIVLIWGSSELGHKVSEHYMRADAYSDRVIVVSRRGIAALIDEAVRWARNRPDR